MSVLTDRFRRKLTVPAYEVRRGDYLRSLPRGRIGEPALIYRAELPHPAAEEQLVTLTIADLEMQRFHDEHHARVPLTAGRPERFVRQVIFPINAKLRIVRGGASDLPTDNDRLAAQLFGATLPAEYVPKSDYVGYFTVER